MKKFKPRHFTAVGLSLVWLLISLYFISQGLMVSLWSIFAIVALVIGVAAVWVLLTDTYQ